MELKTCKRCNKEKYITDFRKSGKKTDGSTYYRATCKVCDLELENKRKLEKGIKPKTTKTIKQNIKQEPKKHIYEFSQDEIKQLKQLLKANTITSNNFTENYNFNKEDRIKATYNIQKDIKISLDEYSKKININKSDIVNIALKNYLKNI